MANNIENRVTKLENQVGINQEPETVEEMLAKLDRGEYGKSTTMSIVAACMSASDKGQFFKSLRKHFPGPLVDVFQLRLEKMHPKMMEPDRA